MRISSKSFAEILSRTSFDDLILSTDQRKTTLLQDDISRSMKRSKEIVVFNVGGMQFHVLRSNFAIMPTTRLSRLVRAQTKQDILQLCDGYVYRKVRPEYHFHRNPQFFNSVLDLYRQQELHGNCNSCSMPFHADLKYWGVDEYLMESCCMLKHYSEREKSKSEVRQGKEADERHKQRLVEEDFGTSLTGKTRKYLLNLVEYPESSTSARV